MDKRKVTEWEACIRYLPGRSIGDGSPEIVRGPLRAIECYIRRADDSIECVTLCPIGQPL